MAKHYAVLGVRQTLTQVTAQIAYFRIPVTGKITKVDVYAAVASAQSGDTIFDVNVGSGIVQPSIFASPDDRPKILQNQTSGATATLNVAVTKGQIGTVDLDALPAGGVSIPVFIIITIEDASNSRGTVVYTTASLANNATETAAIPVFGKGWTLYKVAADRASRVRLYTKAAYRTSDAARAIGTDPVGEHGVVADLVLTAANLDLDLSPFAMGANLDSADSTDAIAAIENRSGATSTVQVTFTRVITEE